MSRKNPLKTVRAWLPAWATKIVSEDSSDTGFVRSLFDAEVLSRHEAVEIVNLRVDNMVLWQEGLRPGRPLVLEEGEKQPLRWWLSGWCVDEHVARQGGLLDLLDREVASTQEALDLVSDRIEERLRWLERLRPDV